MFKDPFSFEGRIRRLEYGLSHIIGIFAFYLFSVIVVAFSGADRGDSAAGIILLCYIPYLWFIWAQGAKRCHDIGNSGWWQLIPLYGLWMLFQDGQPGPNQYGENPKGIQTFGGQIYQTGPNTGNSGTGYQGGYSGGHNNPNTNYSSTQNPSNSGGYNNGDLYR